MSKREQRAARRAEKDANRLFKEHHREEAERLRRVILAATGRDITVQGCEVLWMLYSDDYWAAGWMGMPESDEDLMATVLEHNLLDDER